MIEPTALLSLEGVRKDYPGDVPVPALRGADLDFPEGQFVSIVGPSGSGKSTLLNLLGLLDRPTSGRILLEGEDVSTLSERALSAKRAHRIGFVFQQFLLLDGLTALQNVEHGLLYRGVGGRERTRRATAALERVGMAHRAGHRPGQLSGGEQQRVTIARGLVGDPALLLADEPTGNLDSANGESVLELLHSLHDEGRTLILVTHDEGVANQAERRVSLRDGQVVEDTLITRAGTG